MTGARIARRVAGAALLLAAGLTCTPPEPAEVVPVTAGAAPEIRIGLVTGAARVELSGDSGLVFLDGEQASLAVTDPGVPWRARAAAGGVALNGPTGPGVDGPSLVVVLPRHPDGLVTVNGRGFRGRIELAATAAGLTVINRLDLESYLLGVLGAEMGRRDPEDAEALAAQAIVSRTFAIRNLGKRAAQGFDLQATVVDQVYGGVATEYPLAAEAVHRTAGRILTWQGLPIDAFFFSTCAGRTADGTEVFAAADRPYLKSVPDTDPSGQAYCRISPRFRWRETWTEAQLGEVLRQGLPRAAGVAAADVAPVGGVTVTRRTPSGRVARITFLLHRGTAQVEGPAIRQVLHPVGEPSLRSATFELQEEPGGGRVTRLVADGQGAGHGVGFCQWGAVGRSRAGQDAAAILRAYFPGTDISRAY